MSNSEVVAAVEYAIKKGRIIVVAAGNWGPSDGTMSYLAKIPGVISVGSADFQGTKVSHFSSRGRAGVENSGPTVVAPGEDIIGIWDPTKQKSRAQRENDINRITVETYFEQTGQKLTENEIEQLRNDHTVMTGTSQACAHVTGLMAKFGVMCTQRGRPCTPATASAFLRSVARPISGISSHIQGFGFVSRQSINALMDDKSELQ